MKRYACSCTRTQTRYPMPAPATGPSVEFHFDFGSPNAYFSHRLIPGIEARTGARFAYVPILLGGVFKLTNNQSPMLQFKGVKNKPDYQATELRRFIAKHQMDRFRMNPH